MLACYPRTISIKVEPVVLRSALKIQAHDENLGAQASESTGASQSHFQLVTQIRIGRLLMRLQTGAVKIAGS